MALFFDIETYKDISDEGYIAWKTAGISAPSNYKDPIKIAENIAQQKSEMMDKFALSPLTGKVILIGCLTDVKLSDWMGEPTHQFNNKKYWVVQLIGEEKEMLAKFWDMLRLQALQAGDHLVSYNGKQFDLPFLLHRSAILNIKPSQRIIIPKLLSKYQHEPHLDLFNWFGSGSLVEWSYKLGISNSLERDGGKIGGWYEAGQMDIIKQKNSIDLFQTAEIYERVKSWL